MAKTVRNPLEEVLGLVREARETEDPSKWGALLREMGDPELAQVAKGLGVPMGERAQMAHDVVRTLWGYQLASTPMPLSPERRVQIKETRRLAKSMAGERRLVRQASRAKLGTSGELVGLNLADAPDSLEALIAGLPPENQAMVRESEKAIKAIMAGEVGPPGGYANRFPSPGSGPAEQILRGGAAEAKGAASAAGAAAAADEYALTGAGHLAKAGMEGGGKLKFLGRLGKLAGPISGALTAAYIASLLIDKSMGRKNREATRDAMLGIGLGDSGMALDEVSTAGQGERLAKMGAQVSEMGAQGMMQKASLDQTQLQEVLAGERLNLMDMAVKDIPTPLERQMMMRRFL